MFFLRNDFAAVMPPSKKKTAVVFSMAVGSLPMALATIAMKPGSLSFGSSPLDLLCL